MPGGNRDAPATSNNRQPGTVIVDNIWPNTAFEEGLGINTLTCADQGLPNGGRLFHGTAT